MWAGYWVMQATAQKQLIALSTTKDVGSPQALSCHHPRSPRFRFFQATQLGTIRSRKIHAVQNVSIQKASELPQSVKSAALLP